MTSHVIDWNSREKRSFLSIPTAVLDILWCQTKHINTLLRMSNFAFDFGPLVSKIKLITRELGSWRSGYIPARFFKWSSRSKYPTNVCNKLSFLLRCLFEIFASVLTKESSLWRMLLATVNLWAWRTSHYHTICGQCKQLHNNPTKSSCNQYW